MPKSKFNIDGVTISVDNKFIRNGVIYGNARVAANITKQYVKGKYPNVVVSASSEVYSMGSSTNIYISDNFGNPVDENIIHDVKNFGSKFVYGKFNGMIDMYEHNNNEVTTDDGTPIEPATKYVCVENRPKFDTVEEMYVRAKGMVDGNYTFGKITLENAIKKINPSTSKLKRLQKLIDERPITPNQPTQISDGQYRAQQR